MSDDPAANAGHDLSVDAIRVRRDWWKHPGPGHYPTCPCGLCQRARARTRATAKGNGKGGPVTP
jgi:hypothetical protein